MRGGSALASAPPPRAFRLSAIDTTVSCFSFSVWGGERGGREAARAAVEGGGRRERGRRRAGRQAAAPRPLRTLVVHQRAEGEEAQQLERGGELGALQLRGAREVSERRGSDETAYAACSPP